MNRFKITSIVIYLFLVQIVWSQGNQEAIDAAPKAGGTRAHSMGGVTIATNHGIDALYGNPGGLAIIKGLQISISGLGQISGASYFEEMFYRNRKEYYDTDFKFQSIGFALPITIPKTSIKLAWSVGYRRFYDWNRKQTVESEINYNDGNILKTTTTYKTQGLFNVLSIGLGTNISERLYLGMSINVPCCKTYKTKLESIYRYNKSLIQEEWDVHASNLIQLGSIFQVTSRLTFGVSCLITHKFVIQNGNLKSIYNNSISYDRIDNKDEWKIPSTIDFGISYQLKLNLLLAADIQSRPWENIRINDLPIDDVKNGNAYRFGLEYVNRIQFRGGFALDRLPLLDTYKNPVNIKEITAGIGFQFSHVNVDFGASYKYTTFNAKKWGEVGDYTIREFVIYATSRIQIPNKKKVCCSSSMYQM